jgi:hypothetical protein
MMYFTISDKGFYSKTVRTNKSKRAVPDWSSVRFPILVPLSRAADWQFVSQLVRKRCKWFLGLMGVVL